MKEKKIALITGSSGFIGTKLLKRLLLLGYKINALTKTSNLLKRKITHPNVSWYDFSDQGIKLATNNVDFFFYFSVVYDYPEISIEEINLVNIYYPITILKYLSKSIKPVTCIIGDTFYRKFPPNSTRAPRYTSSKIEAAKVIKQMSLKKNLRIAMLIIEQVYGPGEKLTKAYPKVTRQLLDKNITRVKLTKGDQKRDFVFIDDVINSIVMLCENNWNGFVEVGCGSGKSVELKKIFEVLKKVTHSNSELGFGDISKDHDVSDSFADISFLKSIGWELKINLELGLSKLVDDVRNRVQYEQNKKCIK